MNRIVTLILALVFSLLAAGAVIAAPSPNSGQCPGATDPANNKIDTSDGSVVLEAGLTICIHAGNGNTGTFVTDGTSTLADYILASGLLNHGGQVPNVSNYVIYPTETPSEQPSTTPSEQPSEQPSEAPSEQPSTPPSEAPSIAPTPTPDQGGDAGGGGDVTPPPTDTVSTSTPAGSPIPFIVLALAFVLGLGATLARKPRS